jgi:hypothetical protein
VGQRDDSPLARPHRLAENHFGVSLDLVHNRLKPAIFCHPSPVAQPDPQNGFVSGNVPGAAGPRNVLAAAESILGNGRSHPVVTYGR